MTGVIAQIPKFQFSSASGAPLVGGTLTVYLAGTTTPTDTWQDAALTIANTNPVVLDSRGECVLWLDGTKSYKFVLRNAGGTVQWTQDNIASIAGLLAGPNGPGFIGATDFSVNYAVGTLGWIDKLDTVNPCTPPWFCVADGDIVAGTGTINNTGMLACLRYCEDNNKSMFLPGVFRMDGADGELAIRKSIRICGIGAGDGYASLLKYTAHSGFLYTGTGTRRIRTRSLYRASAIDPQDAPLSCALNVQAENVTLKDFAVYLHFTRPADGFDPATEKTNYGADWDVAIFNGCRIKLHLSGIHTVGYWREAGLWQDVTRSTNLPEFSDPAGVPFETGSITNGADGLTMESWYSYGPKTGLKIQGSQPKAGLDFLGYRYTVGGHLEVLSIPPAGATITLAGVVFTFATVGVLSTEIRIGATVQETAINIADVVEAYIDSVMGSSLAVAPIKKATYSAEDDTVFILQRLDYTLTLDYTLASSDASVAVSGATVAAIADPALYYDQVLGAAVTDGRGAFGCSDVTGTALTLYATDHHSRYRRNDATGDPTTDPAGAAMSISGMNAAGRIQGMRFFSCRFATWEPFRIKLGRVNRLQLYGCHIESRGACLSTTGTDVNPNDFTTPQAYGQIYASDKTRLTLLAGTSGTVNKTWFHPTAQLSLTEFGQAGSVPRNRFNGRMLVNSVLANSGELGLASASATDNIRFRAGSTTLATLGSTGLLLSSNITDPVISAGAGEMDLRSASGSLLRLRNGSTTVATIDTTTAILQVSTVVRPGTTNTVKLGQLGSLWSEVFAGNNTINISDGREKIQRGELTDAELRAWERVRPVVFQWSDAVAKKGADVARLSVGYIAQDVAAAFAAEGLDASRYALWCEDKLLTKRTATRAIKRPRMQTVVENVERVEIVDGVAVLALDTITREAPVIAAAPLMTADGDRILDEDGVPRIHYYQVTDDVEEEFEEEVDLGETRMGLRYEQCLVFECAYLRSKLISV